MDASIFIARILGPMFLVMGAGMVAAPQYYRDMAREFLASRALIYIAGVLAFLPGLAIVLTHNVWVLDWRLIVTIFGWLALVGGTFRLLFPGQVKAIGTTMLEHTAWLRGPGIAVIALGAVLSYFGFLG
jgi:uncharacterized protein YjeT (DUF2065 family)